MNRLCSRFFQVGLPFLLLITFIRTVIIGAALLVAAFLPAIQSAWGQAALPELIGFKSGDLELKGFIWKPLGEGPSRLVETHLK